MRLGNYIIYQLIQLKKVDRAAQNPALIKRAQTLLMQEHQPALRPEWEFININKN